MLDAILNPDEIYIAPVEIPELYAVPNPPKTGTMNPISRKMKPNITRLECSGPNSSRPVNIYIIPTRNSIATIRKNTPERQKPARIPNRIPRSDGSKSSGSLKASIRRGIIAINIINKITKAIIYKIQARLMFFRPLAVLGS
jgi:hypothetical protein